MPGRSASPRHQKVYPRDVELVFPVAERCSSPYRDPARQPSSTKPVVSVNPTLPPIEKNRFLLEGDLADVVALYNAGATAPHVVLNLRGEFVFTDDRANVCLFAAFWGHVIGISRSGHASLSTTQRYIEAHADAQRRIVDLV